MNNKQLTKRWKELSIRFKQSKEEIPLNTMFMLCCGETEIKVDNKPEVVVIFYQGADHGSPAVFFKSDKNGTCFAFAYNSEKDTHIKSSIGKFVRNKIKTGEPVETTEPKK